MAEQRADVLLDQVRNFFSAASNAPAAPTPAAPACKQSDSVAAPAARLNDKQQVSDERVQRLHEKLDVVRNNLKRFKVALSGVPESAATKRLLLDLQPGLTDAELRIMNILEAGRTNSETRATLVNLHSELTSALQLYEEREQNTNALMPGAQLSVTIPDDVEAPTRVGATQCADPRWFSHRLHNMGKRGRAPIDPSAVEMPSTATSAAAAAAITTTAATAISTTTVSAASVESPGRVARPIFCGLACVGNTLMLLLEFHVNGWRVQPFHCPGVSDTGLPAFADGQPCESNWMFGPAVEVLDALGAKNDVKIFDGGEVWRLLACNWLHAGVVHLFLNLAGIVSLGVGVERAFGLSSTAFLYLASGLLGAVFSAAFLPGVRTVGASGCVFGIIGAYWSDALLNYLCVSGNLRDAGLPSLLLLTLPSVAVGFTPWVDNWMHLGGALAGACIAALLLPSLNARPPKVYDVRNSTGSGATVTAAGAAAAAQRIVSPLAAASPLRRRSSAILHLPTPSVPPAQDVYLGDYDGAAVPTDVATDLRTPSPRQFELMMRQRRAASDKWHPSSRRAARGSSGSSVIQATVEVSQPCQVYLMEALERTGYAHLNRAQRCLVALAAITLSCLMGLALATLSSDAQTLLRSCAACRTVNCIEAPGLWSCCQASLPGSCVLEEVDGRTYAETIRAGSHATVPERVRATQQQMPGPVLLATCNVTGLPLFFSGCDPRVDAACAAWDPASPASTGGLCRHLCLDC